MTPDQFRVALKAAGMSQREFARRSGVAVSTVHRWVMGRQPIPGWVPWTLSLLPSSATVHEPFETAWT